MREIIDLARQILRAAIEYALFYNLPLPHSVRMQFVYKGRLPEWVTKHLDDPQSRHHVYYKFAVEEYDKIYRLLTSVGAFTEPEAITFEYGKRLLETYRSEIAQRGTVILGLPRPSEKGTEQTP